MCLHISCVWDLKYPAYFPPPPHLEDTALDSITYSFTSCSFQRRVRSIQLPHFFLFVCFDLCRRSCFYSNGRESCAWAVIQNLVSMMWLYQWTWCTPVSFSSTRSSQNMTFLHATVFCWMSLFSLVFLCVFVISFLSSVFSRLLRCWLKWSHSQSLVVSNPAPYCCWMAAWLKPHICPNKWLWWGSPLHR